MSFAVISFAIILYFNIIHFKNADLLQNIPCKIFSGRSLIIFLKRYLFFAMVDIFTQNQGLLTLSAIPYLF